MKLTVEIDGQQVPLDSCDWVLRDPCGCVRQVMHATSGNGTVHAADKQTAWHAFYDETPRKRDRERLIRKATDAGRTVGLMTISAAVAELMKPCTHSGGAS